MNDSEISRRSMCARLFGGFALAAGALPAVVHASAPERLSSPPGASATHYTFDEHGRLLSIAYNVESAVSAASYG
jgi:hypothetical protein